MQRDKLACALVRSLFVCGRSSNVRVGVVGGFCFLLCCEKFSVELKSCIIGNVDAGHSPCKRKDRCEDVVNFGQARREGEMTSNRKQTQDCKGTESECGTTTNRPSRNECDL